MSTANSSKAIPACPLCESADTEIHFIRDGREFLECAHCDLLFVNPVQFLSAAEEKRRYDNHQNSYEDPRYLSFLSRLKNPLLEKLAPGMRGLDFGSGVSDAMARMFAENGFEMELYDPFFKPQRPAAGSKYDFISCSEVAEHFRNPRQEFDYLQGLLKPAGWLGLMTSLRDAHRGDASWWYLGDPTHVSFYSRQTFEWIAEELNFALETPAENILLLQKR